MDKVLSFLAKECQSLFGESVIQTNMICAGGQEGDGDACDVREHKKMETNSTKTELSELKKKTLPHPLRCQRDQGGPLTCQNSNGGDVVCGLVSFGLGACDTPGYPGVYTEVGNREAHSVFPDIVLFLSLFFWYR